MTRTANPRDLNKTQLAAKLPEVDTSRMNREELVRLYCKKYGLEFEEDMTKRPSRSKSRSRSRSRERKPKQLFEEKTEPESEPKVEMKRTESVIRDTLRTDIYPSLNNQMPEREQRDEKDEKDLLEEKETKEETVQSEQNTLITKRMKKYPGLIVLTSLALVTFVGLFFLVYSALTTLKQKYNISEREVNILTIVIPSLIALAVLAILNVLKMKEKEKANQLLGFASFNLETVMKYLEKVKDLVSVNDLRVFYKHISEEDMEQVLNELREQENISATILGDEEFFWFETKQKRE